MCHPVSTRHVRLPRRLRSSCRGPGRCQPVAFPARTGIRSGCRPASCTSPRSRTPSSPRRRPVARPCRRQRRQHGRNLKPCHALPPNGCDEFDHNNVGYMGSAASRSQHKLHRQLHDWFETRTVQPISNTGGHSFCPCHAITMPRGQHYMLDISATEVSLTVVASCYPKRSACCRDFAGLASVCVQIS